MNSTEETNKIIAEFMGAKAEQWYPENKVNNQTGIYLVFAEKETWPEFKKHHGLSLLKYNCEWNWLMMAVAKCFKLYSDCNSVNTKMRMMYDANVFRDINLVYSETVKFINWYSTI